MNDGSLWTEIRALRSRSFCFTALSYQKYFNKQHIFIVFGNIEGHFLLIPGFSRTTTLCQGLSRIFKNHCNPSHGNHWLMITKFQGLTRAHNVFFQHQSSSFSRGKTKQYQVISKPGAATGILLHCFIFHVATQSAFYFMKTFIIIKHSESGLSNTVPLPWWLLTDNKIPGVFL